MKKTVLAIDIGSTKICAIIADVDTFGTLSIIGAGIAKAHGLKRGSITNIEVASKSIRSAVNDAKRVAGADVSMATVSISGAYTKSLNSSGIVNLPNKEVGITEIDRVIQTSLYNANIPNEYDVLHVLPYNFKVDDQDYIEDPLGMNASRLEVDTHIITAQKSSLNNLRKSVKLAGVDVDSIVLSSYASAIAVLNEDEKDLGVAVIDLGGNTSNIAIHSGNSIRFNDFLGVGSNHITSDLSMALHTPLDKAEYVKLTYGSLLTPSNELIELPIIGDENNTHEVSLEVVHNVIYARVEETLMILVQAIEKSNLKEHLGAGVVLTGGFSRLEGIRELTVAIFDNLPVRLAKPKEMEGLFDNLRDPAYSSAIGLLQYAAGSYTPYEMDVNKNIRHSEEDESLRHPQDLRDLAPEHEAVSKEYEEETLSVLPDPNEKKSDEAGFIAKFWNWATQLF